MSNWSAFRKQRILPVLDETTNLGARAERLEKRFGRGIPGGARIRMTAIEQNPPL